MIPAVLSSLTPPRKYLCSTIILLGLTCAISFGQVNISETFQKTLKKIAKERAKSEVISWITDQDPMSGIIARDLIAQLLDGKDQQTLLRSTTNVVTTMLFLGGIKKHVEAFVDSAEEITAQANSVGWTRNQLVSYSCLYYYYSERLKYKLYVSPEILKMSQEKSRIESFRLKDDRKWSATVSGNLISLRRKDKDLSVDVRLLEVLDKSLWQLISDQGQSSVHSDSIFSSLVESYSDTSFRNMLSQFKANVRPGRMVESLFEVYRKPYEQFHRIDRVFSAITDELTEEAARSQLFGSNILVTIYASLVSTAQYDFVDHQQLRPTILSSVRNLLEYWMSRSQKDGWKIDYAFSLATTAIAARGSTSVDFTVLDQVRFVKYFETTRLFVYCGGFFDPLFKSTIDKTGLKVYLVGIGFGWHSAYFAISAGIQYPEVNLKNIRMAVSLGYDIPVADLLD